MIPLAPVTIVFMIVFAVQVFWQWSARKRPWRYEYAAWATVVLCGLAWTIALAANETLGWIGAAFWTVVSWREMTIWQRLRDMMAADVQRQIDEDRDAGAFDDDDEGK